MESERLAFFPGWRGFAYEFSSLLLESMRRCESAEGERTRHGVPFPAPTPETGRNHPVRWEFSGALHTKGRRTAEHAVASALPFGLLTRINPPKENHTQITLDIQAQDTYFLVLALHKMIQSTSDNDLDESPKHKDLIYDVGMHKGEDTEFYLRKGFRVVAFEADPDLADRGREKFSVFIDQGQLTIVEGAIVCPDSLKVGQKTITFYKNDTKSVWGTVCSDWVERNVRLATSSTAIEVEVVDFASMIRTHGMPHYLKVDIEGVDMVCIEALKQFKHRPDYVSLESEKTSFRFLTREIDVLTELGYDKFKAIEQSGIPCSQLPPNPAREGIFFNQRFEPGSSGLFGRELPGRWVSRSQVIMQYRFIRLGYILVGNDGILNKKSFPGVGITQRIVYRFLKIIANSTEFSWFDTHAKHSSADRHEVL
jgi:FkbM family methyltransferase